jgi:hypothetical protein
MEDAIEYYTTQSLMLMEYLVLLEIDIIDGSLVISGL